ncbi:MAG TPA: oligopeptide transporter, OPT family [Clostridia bacterium]|nr:oligopeptide transporter, OPT family [Clostridia bacterium]
MSNQISKEQEFKPYISAESILPEFTLTALILGILLSVIFGAANAYLGLKVGMTISASIPAAVISMGIIRGLLKKDSILENNMVQTIGSAGESVAAGAIFTLPAMFIWMEEWNEGAPSLITISAIAIAGGILGVLFMVPLRKALIVKEHGTLPYPEGTACAEVLLAGEEGGEKAKITFIGLGVGAVYKFITGGFKLFPSEIETVIPGFKGAAIGADVLPALLGVGFIIGPKIAGYMLGGAVVGWFALIPLITNIGSMGEIILYPATVPISELGYWGIWDNYIRYVGAGAVAFGGVFSLIKSLPLIVGTFRDAMKNYSNSKGIIRTDRDMSMKVVILGILAVILAMMMSPAIPVGFVGAILIAIFGFFFATVSSRVVGLVGSSSNPVSGMTIATLIVTAIVFKATGNDGHAGMIATLSVGAVICIIAAVAGDTSQDLKTGFLVGATPRHQQYGELIGALAAALAIGGVLVLLSNAWGFGSAELPAPQATLMRLVIEGVMGGNLPWNLVFAGVGIGIGLELLGLPVLPIAIGLYLPIHLSTPIMVGGLIRGILNKKLDKVTDGVKSIKEKIDCGILYSSGLIAGEGLVGILLAVFAVAGVELNLGFDLGQIGALAFFGLLVLSLLKYSLFKKTKM